MTSPQKVQPFSEPLLFSWPVIVVRLNCWPHFYSAPHDCRRYRSVGLYPQAIRTRAEIRMKWTHVRKIISVRIQRLCMNEPWDWNCFSVTTWKSKVGSGTKVVSRAHACFFYVHLFFSLFLALHQSIAFFLSGHHSISFQTWIWTLITVAMLDISKLSGQSDWQPNWNTDI